MTHTPLRLLLVDDSEDERWLLEDELTQGGFAPEIVRLDDADALVRALAEQQWDLMLVDYVMPHFSAPAALDIYHQSGLDIPFIIISAQVEESVAVAMMEQGVHDFIAKGSRTRLLPAIRRELAMAERRRRQRESERRYAQIFQGVEVSIWEEDLSAVWLKLEQLRAEGVEDLHSHLLTSSDDLYQMLGGIRILDVNPATLRMLEMESIEQLRGSLEEVFTPASLPMLVDELCAIWNGEEIFRAEAPHRTRSGRRLTVIVSLPVPHSLEEARRVPVTLIDITEEKRAEQRQAELAVQNRLILDTVGKGVFGIDVHGMYTFVNPMAAELLGWSVEELMRQNSRDVWQARSADDALGHEPGCEINRVLAEGRVCQGEGHFTRRNGSTLEVEFNASPLRQRGEIRGAVVTFSDISERKRAEQHLNSINRILATLSQCNQSLVRSRSEEQLLSSLCGNLIDYGGYAFAWVALVGQSGEFTLSRWAGDKRLSEMQWQPVLHALRDCLEQLPKSLPLSELRAQLAHCPLALDALFEAPLQCILPLHDADGLLGFIGVCHASMEVVDEEEMGLLEELADDLTFGFRSLRTRTERDNALQALDEALLQTISAITLTLEKRDPYTAGHQQRVARLAERIGQELGYSPERLRGLRIGALLHDIGKIAIPAEILSRPGKLSAIEYRLIQEHPRIGDEIMHDVNFPWPVARMIREHHECLDGSGYPDGLKGEAILHESRILAVSDVIEAMTSHRPYRPARTLGEALQVVRDGAQSGRYDPEVVTACEQLIEQLGEGVLE